MTSSRGRAVLAALAGFAGLALAGCGTAAREATVAAGKGCLTTVRSTLQGPGALSAGWLPARFRPARQDRASGLPAVTYVAAGTDPPRLELAVSNHPQPIRETDAAGRSTVRWTKIRGHRALLGTGPPDPDFVNVYFKPAPGYLLGVVGYKLPARVVLRAARQVRFTAPGTISLPIAPGPIVARAAAVTAAERSGRVPWRQARAKLSSWIETAAVLAAHTRRDPAAAPGALRGAPWRPVWSVLLTRPGRSLLVVVDAATGKAVYAAIARTRWFAALTDRDPAGGVACPGGSSARLPFGVLTRTEERYAAGWRPPYRSGGSRNSTRLVLSTVPAVNRADPGMFGGCVQQDCAIDQLVWVDIMSTSADAGHRLTCPPPSVSVPAGYRYKKVKQIFTVNVPDNSELGCGPVPAPFRKLIDLAPALPALDPHASSR